MYVVAVVVSLATPFMGGKDGNTICSTRFPKRAIYHRLTGGSALCAGGMVGCHVPGR